MNIYKYPDFNISREECDNILESMNYPNPDYTSEEPVTVYVDLLVEKIFEINGKEMEFEAFYSMWHDWKEKRLRVSGVDSDGVITGFQYGVKNATTIDHTFFPFLNHAHGGAEVGLMQIENDVFAGLEGGFFLQVIGLCGVLAGVITLLDAGNKDLVMPALNFQGFDDGKRNTQVSPSV